MNEGPELTLLYDGVCGFCDRMVRFVLARDKKATMQFAALQSEFAAAVVARHPRLHGLDSLVLVLRDDAGESVTTEYAAVMKILHYLGGGWGSLATVMGIVPGFIGNAGYRMFARMRYRIFGRYASCPVPSPDQRARFIRP